MLKQFYFKLISISYVSSWDVNTVLFQTIPFCLSTQFSSIWSIDRTLSGATTLGQSWAVGDSYEGVFRFPQSSIITGTSPCVSHQNTRWGLLPICRCAVGVFYSPSRLGEYWIENRYLFSCFRLNLMDISPVHIVIGHVKFRVVGFYSNSFYCWDVIYIYIYIYIYILSSSLS